MANSSFIFDQQYGLLLKPMCPTPFGKWKGWIRLHFYGWDVQCISKIRFSSGLVIAAEKTLNDDWWHVRVEQTALINSIDLDDDDTGFSQGVLF